MTSSFRIGTPGKQYGLIKPKPSTLKLFSVEEEEVPENIPIQVGKPRVEADRKRMKKIALEQEKILQADPNAFDYDGLFDNMKKDLEEQGLRKKQESAIQHRKPKYMDEILKKT